MNTGQIISGAAHAGLIGWLIAGGAFRSEPLPFEVTEVSVISADAFEALLTTGAQAVAPTEVALPAEPEVRPDPVAPPAPEPQVDLTQPAPLTPPDAEQPPEPAAPQPEPEVVEDTPAPLAPPTPPVSAPDISSTPVPRPADRIAPDVVDAPDPEAVPDPVTRDAVEADEGAEADTPLEEQEATAPEEASDQIVTEAEEPAGAPVSSLRPPARRPTPPAPQPTAQPTTATDDTADAVEDALRAALDDAPQPAVPRGPPLSAGEKDALRVAVSACWNVGSLSSEALRTTVTVALDMEQSGKPIIASIRLIGSEGGSDTAARQAYEAARRAIIRCARDGYDLPADKFGQWQEIEMTFNPERMRIK
ncbi:MAG: energy transducer TonB [Pseudomonadota bacterium]